MGEEAHPKGLYGVGEHGWLFDKRTSKSSFTPGLYQHAIVTCLFSSEHAVGSPDLVQSRAV